MPKCLQEHYEINFLRKVFTGSHMSNCVCSSSVCLIWCPQLPYQKLDYHLYAKAYLCVLHVRSQSLWVCCTDYQLPFFLTSSAVGLMKLIRCMSLCRSSLSGSRKTSKFENWNSARGPYFARGCLHQRYFLNTYIALVCRKLLVIPSEQHKLAV